MLSVAQRGLVLQVLTTTRGFVLPKMGKRYLPLDHRTNNIAFLLYL